MDVLDVETPTMADAEPSAMGVEGASATCEPLPLLHMKLAPACCRSMSKDRPASLASTLNPAGSCSPVLEEKTEKEAAGA